MWRALLFAAIAGFLCLDLAPTVGNRVALAQVRVSFAEWTVPTKGSHPHDPLAVADGSVWYTGQMASTLGRTRSKDRSVQGVSNEDPGFRTSRSRCRRGRQHLVHRQLRRLYREA